MVAEPIEASHVALRESTGRPLIGVFHTSSAGKAGHEVLGNVVAGATEPTLGAPVAVGTGADTTATPRTATAATAARQTTPRLECIVATPLPMRPPMIVAVADTVVLLV